MRITSHALLLCAVLAGACGEEPEPAFHPIPERSLRSQEGVQPIDVPEEAAPRPGAIPAPPDVSAPPPEAERAPSGLASRVLQAGTGQTRPGPRDRVTVHYTGWRAENGEMFDSSVTRGEPATFPLDGVIRGWTEGLQLMVVGEKRRLWIPANMAYEGRPSGPQGMLVFDVELLSFEPAQAPPPG